MGATISSLFLRAAGDVLLAATRQFPNERNRYARRVEGAAMRCAYVALCHCALAKLKWDPSAEMVVLSEAAEPKALARLAWDVCHERLSNEDLWRVRVYAGEKLAKLHEDCVRTEQRMRRARRELSDIGVHDGHLVILEDETPGTTWHDLVVKARDWIPVQSHETLERVIAGASRLCVEEVLLLQNVFDTSAHVSMFPNEQEDHDERIATLAELLPHLAAQVQAHGCVAASGRVMREFEALVARVRRMEDKRLKDEDKHRRFTSTAPSEYIYMMSITSATISDAAAIYDQEKSPMASFEVQSFGGSLEPDPEVARGHFGKILEEAFKGAYSKRADAYVLGRLAARRIAEAAVSACYAYYPPS